MFGGGEVKIVDGIAMGDRSAIDRTARLVTSKGEHYSADLITRKRHWKIKPPTVQPKKRKGLQLTGVRFGRFTVIGLLVPELKTRGAKAFWVAKCDCGRYEARRARHIKSVIGTLGGKDMCDLCRHHQKTKIDKHNLNRPTLKVKALKIRTVNP